MSLCFDVPGDPKPRSKKEKKDNTIIKIGDLVWHKSNGNIGMIVCNIIILVPGDYYDGNNKNIKQLDLSKIDPLTKDFIVSCSWIGKKGTKKTSDFYLFEIDKEH